ncbi:PEP-utilizing enzyme [Streptomyces sioyaensis]|uniref:PEP-utilizing enzyme n=1 Tax=Streptomyces sioyaensis TaxID=67364 RepID=UPI0037912E59
MTERVSVHSGHNFREVAPELLSPLTWSIIGPGMERGFRDAAVKFGRQQPTGPRPSFVSYFGFRPFFNMTTVERLADELPVVDPEDIWELLLGGAGPESKREKRPGKLHRARRLRGALSFLGNNAHAFGRAQAELTAAEAAVLDAINTGGSWQAGSACDAAIKAGRTAWALHIRTTSVALVAASVTKQILRLQYDSDTALELLRAGAHRKEGASASARGGILTEDLHRLNNYEVTDGGGPFARFSSPVLSSAASVLRGKGVAERADTGLDEVGIPLGTALGPVFDRTVRMLGLALGERERSKEIGLRALHCTRVLLDRGAFGADPAEAALLGVQELRQLDARARKRLVDERAEELEEAAKLDFPVDVQQTNGQLTAARRARRGKTANAGQALAPGWAEGVLVQESDGEEGRIVVGDRVDGNYVLAVLPDGVVSKYGSVLSHVAIVCRELGIPFIAGVATDPTDLGKRAVVDGWTGTVSVDAGSPTGRVVA